MKKRMLATTWLIIGILAMGISGTACYASVEPELSMAIRHRNVQRVQILLSEGVNVNERDEGEEQTPLMRAVQVDDPLLVQMLLSSHADVQAQDDSGNTALMFAVQHGNGRIVRQLLEAGANVAPRNAAGATALTMAQTKKLPAIALLLSRKETKPLPNTARKSEQIAANRAERSHR